MKFYLISFRTDFNLTGEYKRLESIFKIFSDANIEAEIISVSKKKSFHSPKKAESFSGHFFDIFIILIKVFHLRKSSAIFFVLLPTPIFSFIGDIIKMMTPNRVIVNFESHLSNLSMKDLFENVKHEPWFYITRFLFNNNFFSGFSLKKADKYIINTQYQYEELLKIGYAFNKIEIIENIIPIIPKGEKISLKNKYSISSQDKVLCYIGHYFHVKGVDILLKAFLILLNKNINLKLIIAWSGLGDNKKIEKLISDLNINNSIILLEKVIVSDIFSIADILVLPYRFSFGSQILPNILLEGISAGIPIVTSNLPVLDAVLQDSVIISYNNNDPTKLAEKINVLLNDEMRCVQCVKNQNKFLYYKYNQMMIKQKYLQLLNV